MGQRRSFLDLRAAYFFYYTAGGVLFPFLNLHFARLGLTGLQMGSLAALAVLVGAAGSVGWSLLADRFRGYRVLLGTAVGGAVTCAFLVSRARDFPSLLAWSGLWSWMGSPILPILDSLAIRAFPEQGGYGRIRVWGTVGWAVATLAMGYLLDRMGILWIFYGYMAGLACTLFAFLLQPMPAGAARPRLAQGLKTLLKNPQFLLFLGSSTALGTALGATSQFFSIYLEQLGAEGKVIGGAWALGAASEIPVMLWAQRFIRRRGLARALRLSFFLFAVRWGLLYLVPSAPWALAIQPLHGAAFGLFIVGGVTYTDRLAPPGLGTTAQALFSTVSFGLSSLGGAMFGGYMYDTVGLRVLFLVLSGITLAGFALLLLVPRRTAHRGVSSGVQDR